MTGPGLKALYDYKGVPSTILIEAEVDEFQRVLYATVWILCVIRDNKRQVNRLSEMGQEKNDDDRNQACVFVCTMCDVPK